MVEDFEREFAKFCDTQYCVGVNSGTDALRFAFMAADVKPGEIIVTVPHTFIATTEAISQVGAHIAFVDINEKTYTMDPEKLARVSGAALRIRQEPWQIDRKSLQARGVCNRAGSSVRPDCRHGSDSGTRQQIQSGGD